MQIKANLFYGRSTCPVTAPENLDLDNLTNTGLAALCLAHMSKQAGGFMSTMAQGVSVARHPAGRVTVNGNGWCVNFDTTDFDALAKAAHAGGGVENLIAFVSQFVTENIPAETLVLLHKEGRFKTR